jgi:hypothetical protein
MNRTFFLTLLLILAACTPTAADPLTARATPHPVLVATAQADQYWRDAGATTQARQMEQIALTATFEADLRNVQATAGAGAATVQARQTREAVAFALTTDAATVQAQQIRAAATAEAQATAVMLARQENEARATAQAQATTAAFTATQQALAMEQAAYQARRDQLATAAAGAFLVLVAALALGLGGWFLWQLLPTLVRRAGVVHYGQHRNPLLLVSDRHGRTVVADPLRMLQAAVTIDENGRVNMPDLTPDAIQTAVAGGTLRLLLEQARIAPGHPPQLPAEVTSRRRVGPVETAHTVRNSQQLTANSQQLTVNSQQSTSHDGRQLITNNQLPITSPPWSVLAAWDGPGLAIGAGAGDGIVAVDLARTPHLFVTGMSGSGKTRRLLRPLVAQALADGYYVVLMNESGSDFSPFYDRDNVAIVRGAAQDYVALLEAALREMNRREAVLRRARVSEWRRLPAELLVEQPLLLLAMDELLALAMLLAPGEQRAFWGLLAAFASRARKVGMASIGLATDPTFRALGQGGLNYRSQCARISFRLMQAAGSRAVLDAGGAEGLTEGQFLALLDRPGLVPGATANPGREELAAYLDGQPVTAVVEPEWLPAARGQPGPPVVRGRPAGQAVIPPPIINLPAAKPETTGWRPAPPVAATTTGHNRPQAALGHGQPVAQPSFSPDGLGAASFDATRPPTAAERALICDLYAGGLSKNGICRRLYGFKDGRTFAYVTAALAEPAT